MADSMLRYGVLALLMMLMGCSAVDSYSVTPDYVSDSGQRAGVYYLPKHLLALKLSGDRKNPAVTAITTAVQDQRLALETGLALSPLSDDNITVTYTTSGLLASVTATLTDKTGDIIVELVKLAAQLRDAPAQGAFKEISFDPFDEVASRSVNTSLRNNGICVEVELSPGIWSPGCGPWSQASSQSARRTIISALPAGISPGIYYRRAATLMVHIVQNGETVQLLPLPFANASPIYRIDIRRTLFVTRGTTIAFTDGALTSVNVTKPSEGLAVAQLPAKIIQAFASAVTGGVAGAQSSALEAKAAERNSAAKVNDAVAARVATGNYDASVPSGDNRTADLQAAGLRAGARSSRLTPAETAACEKIGFESEACLTYYSE